MKKQLSRFTLKTRGAIERFNFEKVEPRGARRLRLKCSEPASVGERNGKRRRNFNVDMCHVKVELL